MVSGKNGQCLIVRDLSARRNGRTVLSNVTFSIRYGEIVSIIGPNGAGKSTLFDLITGFLKPYGGSVLFEGVDLTSMNPHKICHIGIARTFQIPRPFSGMTALENVMAAAMFGKRGDLSPAEYRNRAESILDLVGIAHKASTRACSLTLSEQRRLEVARALATQPRLLLLDEFAAGLSPQAINSALELIENLRNRGLTLIIIDHFLNVTVRVSDRLIALDRGRVVAEGDVEYVLNNPAVASAYLGVS
ncbi:ABC transporter ATP-binding protein [Thermodesulforhabdus norvegica]|uniref:Branched-chain amino acid transport system ATP-binding protein n=1 Tax=Thermodesulforhabdus norvegica TaxID=39841 RepID=A0A1I4UQD7_9BACT|nr:ABC transporter ATP-binding protein [Thermodesulforhabdus norvegica]SFM91184.1 branched-chain amino acid transport system ATP-binding protein [Thermodesulforhabdus norvegica]